MAARSYPEYSTRSGWNALLPARASIPPLDADVHADVAIIGAGYTGLAAGRQWARVRGDDRVVVLEASEVGEGNPGRNSGFLLDIMLANDADAGQLARMQSANELVQKTMNGLRDDIYDAHIDCNVERAGTYRAAAGAAGLQALKSYQRFLDAAALPYERLDREILKLRLGTEFYSTGLYSPHCYLVQPAALIRGLAGLLPESVTLYENTPALRLVAERGQHKILTPEGSVTAGKVIVANNAFAKSLGIAPSRIVAMYTYAALTAPLTDWLAEAGGSEVTWGLLPAHRLGCTLRRTRDDRLLIRSHYDYERERDSGTVAGELMQSLKRRFPGLPVNDFEHVWGGATGYTRNGAPVWGEVRDGLYVSAGCNGGGVVKGTLFGELLADLALGREVSEVIDLFGSASWMPPDPLRRAGFELLSRLERQKAAAEM